MTRCFRFLLRFSLINLAVFAAAAAVIVGGAFVTDVPSGNTNLFSTYFDGFPALSLFILFMMAFSMTSTLTLALNFGATRKALFVALQGVLAIYAVGGWAISALFSLVPVWFGWPREGAATVLMLNTSPAFLAAAAAAAVLGVLSGVMMIRSRVIGSMVIILAMLLMMAGTSGWSSPAAPSPAGCGATCPGCCPWRWVWPPWQRTHFCIAISKAMW